MRKTSTSPETIAKLKTVLRNMILNQSRIYSIPASQMVDIMADLIDELQHAVENNNV